MTAYDKPWLSIEDQIDKLRKRNLEFVADEHVARVLERVGYYRLTGYLHPFRESVDESPDPDRSQFTLLTSYKPGTALEHIEALIEFDRKLRLLILDGVEKIEISLRMRIGYRLGEQSPFAHLDTATFEQNFVRTYRHGKWVARAEESQSRSHELFVRHFENAYGGQLPIWALTELLELGQLAVLYSGLQRELATSLARSYDVPTKKLFRSWLASINGIRNFSAHHARLFNRKLIHAPKRPTPGTIPVLDHLAKPGSSKNGFGIYNVLAIMAFILSRIDHEADWPQKMSELVKQFPANDHIGISSMGFPEEWESLELWRQ